jgi:hypothetical protein
MFRIVLLNLFMFLLPFMVYGAYMLVATGGQTDQLWKGAPIVWLLIVGLVLLIVTIGAIISFSGWAPGGVYQPPRIEDGVIRPGTFDR